MKVQSERGPDGPSGSRRDLRATVERIAVRRTLQTRGQERMHTMAEIFRDIRRFISWTALLAAWMIAGYAILILPGMYTERLPFNSGMTTDPLYLDVLLTLVAAWTNWGDVYLLHNDPLAYLAYGSSALAGAIAHLYFLSTPVIAVCRARSRLTRRIGSFSPLLALIWLQPWLYKVHHHDACRFESGIYVLASSYLLAMFAILIYPQSPFDQRSFPVVQAPSITKPPPLGPSPFSK